MPMTPDEAAATIRDPNFQAMDPKSQITAFKSKLMETGDAEGLGDTALTKVAVDVIKHHTPGFMEKALEMVPIVGPAKRAYENPASARPLTKQLVQYLGGAEAVNDPLLMGLAEGLRDTGEMIAFGAIGGLAARGLAVGAEAAAGSLTEALASGTIAAAQKAAQAARYAMHAKHAIAGGVDLGLYQLGQNAEQVVFNGQDQHLFRDLILQPTLAAVAGAGLGVAIPAALKLLLRGAPDYTTAIMKHGSLDRAAAADLVTEAMQGPVNQEQFRILKAALKENPQYLDHPFAQQILKAQEPNFHPKVSPAPPEAPLRIVLESPTGRRTYERPTEEQLVKIEADIRAGNARMDIVSGQGAEAVAQRGTQALKEFNASGASMPMRSPEAGEAAFGMQPNPIEPLVRGSRTPTTIAEETSFMSAKAQEGGRPIPKLPPELVKIRMHEAAVRGDVEAAQQVQQELVQSVQREDTMREIMREQLAGQRPSGSQAFGDVLAPPEPAPPMTGGLGPRQPRTIAQETQEAIFTARANRPQFVPPEGEQIPNEGITGGLTGQRPKPGKLMRATGEPTLEGPETVGRGLTSKRRMDLVRDLDIADTQPMVSSEGPGAVGLKPTRPAEGTTVNLASGGQGTVIESSPARVMLETPAGPVRMTEKVGGGLTVDEPKAASPKLPNDITRYDLKQLRKHHEALLNQEREATGDAWLKHQEAIRDVEELIKQKSEPLTQRSPKNKSISNQMKDCP